MDAVEEGRFRGEPAVIVSAGELSATFLPDVGHDRRLAPTSGSRAPGAPRRPTRLAVRGDAGPPVAGAVGEPAGVAPVPGRRRRRRPDRPPAGHRRQRPSRSTACSWASRDGVSIDARLVAAGQASGPRSMSTRRRFRTRTGSRSSSSPVSTSSRSTRRSSRPAPVRSRWRSDGTRTCGCRARHGASGSCGCRPAPISPSTGSASQPAVRRPSHGRPNRSAGAPSTTCTSSAASVASPWWPTRTPRSRSTVDPGIRTPRCGYRPATVRRVGADGSRHEQPGRRHDTARGTRRGVHRQLHALGRGTQ